MLRFFFESLYYSIIIFILIKISILIIFKKFKYNFKNICNMYFQINKYYVIDLSIILIFIIFIMLFNFL